MNAPWASAFYGSAQWKKCRKAYIQYRRGMCERCLGKGIITMGTEVHHKIRLTPDNVNDASVSLNWDNLELLCKQCHDEAHHKSPRYTTGPDGRVTGNDVDLR